MGEAAEDANGLRDCIGAEIEDVQWEEPFTVKLILSTGKKIVISDIPEGLLIYMREASQAEQFAPEYSIRRMQELMRRMTAVVRVVEGYIKWRESGEGPSMVGITEEVETPHADALYDLTFDMMDTVPENLRDRLCSACRRFRAAWECFNNTPAPRDAEYAILRAAYDHMRGCLE